jgi:hypothetical protein
MFYLEVLYSSGVQRDLVDGPTKPHLHKNNGDDEPEVYTQLAANRDNRRAVMDKVIIF